MSLPNPGRVDLAGAGVDGVYVAHCRALTDRERYLAAALRVCGMDAEWVEAMDAVDVPQSLIRERVTNERLTRQEISLFLKHERIFRTIIERGQHAALVLEDDVVLPADFCDRLALSVRRVPPDYDLVFLGASCDLHVKPQGDAPFGAATRSRSTCAYLVTAACCRMMLAAPGSISLPIDHHLDRLIKAMRLNVYWQEPPLLLQGSETGAYRHSLGVAWREGGGASPPRGGQASPRVPRLRRNLRRFASLVGVVRAVRGLRGDLQILRGRLRQRPQLAAYLAGHPVCKLHLGCGANLLPGWLNTDLLPWNDSVMFLDATAPFPLPDASVDYLFSEHMIEHVSHADGLAMLRECSRVLKPGGVLRIATPDLCRLVSLLTQPAGAAQVDYLREATDRFLSHSRRYRPGLVLNHAISAFGHRFIYDAETLRDALVDAGFERIHAVQRGISSHGELSGLERHAVVTGEAIDRFETMLVEATKPA